MDRTEKAALCEIHALDGVGSGALWKVYNEWRSFSELYKANEAALHKILPPEAANDLIQRRALSHHGLPGKIEAQGFQVVSILDETIRYH